MNRLCSTCQQDHTFQITAYPLGATVKITQLFYNDLPVGTLGKVINHCDDGRATILFGGTDLNDEQLSLTPHTFHYPDGYIQLCGVSLLLKEIANAMTCLDSHGIGYGMLRDAVKEYKREVEAQK